MSLGSGYAGAWRLSRPYSVNRGRHFPPSRIVVISRHSWKGWLPPVIPVAGRQAARVADRRWRLRAVADSKDPGSRLRKRNLDRFKRGFIACLARAVRGPPILSKQRWRSGQ
jgi:hypothetical protein